MIFKNFVKLLVYVLDFEIMYLYFDICVYNVFKWK